MHSIAEELARHAAALRGLACDLVGEQAAEDVVQDAAVEALRAGPRRPGPMGGWLAGIVRHLASRHRRAERRRTAREQRASRGESVPPHDELSDREIFQRLTAAVMALPEPYQGTVLRRYLRGSSPAEISRDSGVPLATVKTRLQRGLTMLRQRLAREGADWRPALCATFGLDMPVLSATAATATGVLLMGTGAKVGVACAAIALLAALWWGAGSEWTTSARTATPEGSTAALTGAVAAAATSADHSREEVIDAAAALPLADGRIAVRGCCVDEQGAPLPRCAVELRGRKELDHGGPDLRVQYGEWLVTHPDRAFHDLTATTDDQGRFEFAFDFVPLAYQLRVERDQIHHVVRIGAVHPGDQKDLGNITIQAGCELPGRVVDSNGAAVASPVYLWDHSGSYVYPTQAIEHPSGPCQPAPDGTFTTHRVAGEYDVHVESRLLVSSKMLTIPKGQSRLEFEVVVDAGSRETTISGVVVDQAGQPVAGLRIMFLGPAEPEHAGTDAAGRFVLYRPRGSTADRVTLFVPGIKDEPLVQWGTHDLRLVATPESANRSDIEFTVLTERDGVPVTGYELFSGNLEDSGALDQKVTAAVGDAHAGGVARLPGVPTRPLGFLVVPDRADLWFSDIVVPEGSGLRRIEVRLPSSCRRPLVVRHEDGSAAAGVTVEQLIAGREPLSLTQPAYTLQGWVTSSRWSAALMQQTATDSQGQVTLRGPANGTIAVRLPGPPALLVPEVRLDTGEPLVITVPGCGRIEGHLTPPELVRELRLANGWPEQGPVEPAGPAPVRPGFCLQRGDKNQGERVPAARDVMVMVAGDGHFTVEAVPAGSWQLMFAGAGDAEIQTAVRTVEVRAGETTNLVIDLSEERTGELQGQLVHNGKPMADELVRVYASSDLEGERPHACGKYDQRTDADGRFRLRMRRGTARAVLMAALNQPGWGLWNLWASREQVFVPAGGSVTQVFHFERGKLRLRVLDSDGKPQPGVPLLLRGDDGRLLQTTTSDAEGWLSADADVHPFQVQVLPRSVERPAGRIADWANDRAWGVARADPFAGQWLTLGRVTPKMGETVEMELRLPSEWGQ